MWFRSARLGFFMAELQPAAADALQGSVWVPAGRKAPLVVHAARGFALFVCLAPQHAHCKAGQKGKKLNPMSEFFFLLLYSLLCLFLLAVRACLKPTRLQSWSFREGHSSI